MRRLFTLLLALTPLLSAEPLKVVTTTTMITELVTKIGGEHVEVTGLMGPGVDPHLYRPNQGDLKALREADVIFHNGYRLEGRLSEVLATLNRPGTFVVAIAEELAWGYMIQVGDNVVREGAEKLFDPHFWGDPRLWAEAVHPVVATLAQADMEHMQVYRTRGADLKGEYLQLYDWVKERIDTIPAERRVLITAHDAFSYYGKAFGIEVFGIQGLSTANEAGLADLSRLADFIKERDIPAIFVETSVSPKAIQRLAEDSGAAIGGELFSDAMGKPGDMETFGGETYDLGTYTGMMKHNTNRIVEALGTAAAPEEPKAAAEDDAAEG